MGTGRVTRKDRQRFEELMLPHRNAAYNLARWLVRDPHEAEDVVQIAYVRAFEGFGRFAPGNGAGWILAIVRNTAYTWLSQRKRSNNLVSFDEVLHSQPHDTNEVLTISDPEMLVSQTAERTRLVRAIHDLPLEFREALVLREIEGCSYKEIADITKTPVGTVMSRLSRARRLLHASLCQSGTRDHAGGM